MPDETTPTASFKLTLEVKGKETDTLTWENPTCPLTEVSARQAIILGAFADAAKRRASGGTVV